MAQSAVRHIEVFLPSTVLDNEQLARDFETWSPEKIQEKTGITLRHIAGKNESCSDMAVKAAEQLFESKVIGRSEIDYVLLCTQSPDYFLPTTACIVQDRLGLRTACGALDFNLGCSGYVVGLGMAKGLIETGQAANILLLTTEAYSRYIHPRDKSVRTLFGDAATATLVSAVESDRTGIGPLVYGTDGSGSCNLIVPTGGMREAYDPEAQDQTDESGNVRTRNNLYMNGAEIFTFTLKAVPAAIESLLVKAGMTLEEIDLFVFHQANEFMLESLRRKTRIPKEKFAICMSEFGNTVSSTIPIALRQLQHQGRLHHSQKIMLVGFGVGYSWAAAILDNQFLVSNGS